MANLSSLFSVLIRDPRAKTGASRPAPPPDIYECYCTNCACVTVWRLRAVVAGRALYKCERCGAQRYGDK